MDDFAKDTDVLISRRAAIDKINERQRELIYCFGFENEMVKIMDIARSIIIAMPSAQPEQTSNNDCNGCKFVGCYDTDFPCANCIRKNKDYYAPEMRSDEAD